MESFHDFVNTVNSGDLRSLLKATFFEEGENGRKAANFIEKVFSCGEEEVLEALFIEESDGLNEDVKKLIGNYFCVFEKHAKAVSKIFEFIREIGECVICYETFENTGMKCVVCKNVFHNGCLSAAIYATGKCPMYRTEMDL